VGGAVDQAKQAREPLPRALRTSRKQHLSGYLLSSAASPGAAALTRSLTGRLVKCHRRGSNPQPFFLEIWSQQTCLTCLPLLLVPDSSSWLVSAHMGEKATHVNQSVPEDTS
jgi:hypothetical protein